METQDLPQELIDELVRLSEHYEDFERHNRGANGYLVFARNKVSRMDVAIKFYIGDPGDTRHDEPRQLTEVDNPNVLEILDARVISGDWGYFITPRCFEGDLDDLIARSPTAHQALDVALGICSGCSSIHAVQMLHRDLKPGNIVLKNGQPRIADFGSVRRLADDSSEVSASRHSVLYRPPESFSSGRYSVKGDIYQIGLVTYQLLGGSLPYEGTDYLTARQRARYNAITGSVDRSLFINDVIRQRAEAGRLAEWETLPGWLDGASLRALKRMMHPSTESRSSTTADVAAELTAIRSRTDNWGWVNGVPRLVLQSGAVELRATKTPGEYVAYRDSGNGFRKIPKLAPGSIRQLAVRLTELVR